MQTWNAVDAVFGVDSLGFKVVMNTRKILL